MNVHTIHGRLTRAPELTKGDEQNKDRVNFTVAVDRRFQSQQNGGQSADFINCIAWRQSADFLSSYASKGTIVAVEGRIQTRSYDGQNGKVYVTEVVADTVQLLESRSQSQNRQDNIPAYTPDPEYRGGSDPFSADDFNTGPTLDISSDDLPF